MTRRATAAALGVVAALLGLAGLAGHGLQIAPLVRLAAPGSAALDLASALCLVAGGLLLAWIARPSRAPGSGRLIAALVGGAVALIGILMLIENATGIALGVDYASLQTWLGRDDPTPGRMAANESIGYALIGAALALFPRVAGPNAGLALRVVAGLVAGFGIAALFAGLPALDLAAGWQGAAIMGPQSALGLTALAVRFWFAMPALASNFAGAEEAEVEHVVTIATVVLVAGGAGLVVVQKRVERLIVDHLNEQLSNRATLIASQLDERVERASMVATRPLLVSALQRALADPGDAGARTNLRAIAESYLPYGFSALEFQDLSGRTLAFAGTKREAVELAVGAQLRYRTQLVWQNGFRVRTELAVRDGDALVGRVIAEQPLWILTRQSFDPGAWGETGDAGICAPVGTDAAACFPTRFRKRPFTAQRMVDGAPTAMNRALDGEFGVQKAIDEKGNSMIAAFQPIGTTGLGIETRVARAEVDKPIRDQFVVTVPLVLALVAAGIAVMRWRVRPLVRRIVATRREALTNAARFRAASEGSLDAFSRSTRCAAPIMRSSTFASRI